METNVSGLTRSGVAYYPKKYRWHNATTADLATLDDDINFTQSELTRVGNLSKTCNANVSFWTTYSCHKELGRSQEGLKDDVLALTTQLASLRKQRNDLALNLANTLTLQQQQSTVLQQQAVTSQVESAATLAETKNIGLYLLIGGGVIGVIVAGIFYYKKHK